MGGSGVAWGAGSPPPLSILFLCVLSFSISSPKPSGFVGKKLVLPASLKQAAAAHGCHLAEQYGLGGGTLLKIVVFGERLVSELTDSSLCRKVCGGTAELL